MFVPIKAPPSNWFITESSKNEVIRNRHIIDSAQAIDFIDLKINTAAATDLGSGGGFPGIVIAIMVKNMKEKITK